MYSEILDAVIKGILVGLFMAISVGPTLFAVIKYSMDNSYKAGLAFVLGVSASDIMYVTLANMATGWLKGLGTYTYYIAIGGSLVLMVVGLSGFLRKAAPQQQFWDVKYHNEDDNDGGITSLPLSLLLAVQSFMVFTRLSLPQSLL